MDRTLILVKPDAFERGLTGEIIARFERKGLTIVAMKHMTVERDLAEQHYAEHTERPFFGDLVDFITGGPLVALVLEGHEAVKAARQVIGATNPIEAAPGSIRGDLGSRCRRTSCTARIGLSRQRARRACSSRSLARTLILASSSPRRRAMLEQLGVDFSVEAPDVEELSEGDPRDLVVQNALLKLRAVPGQLVLAVDSMVVWDGRAHGKPADAGRPRPGCASCPAAGTR